MTKSKMAIAVFWVGIAVPGKQTWAACHTGAPGSGSVKVTFPNGLTYTPGVARQLVVTVADTAQKTMGPPAHRAPIGEQHYTTDAFNGIGWVYRIVVQVRSSVGDGDQAVVATVSGVQ
jgi:hypothetical protein